MKRRTLLNVMGAGILTTSLVGQAFAQTEKGVKLVIPFPPGGGGDVLGRSPVDRISSNLKQDIYVLNRPGAGGNLGIAQLIEERNKERAFGYVTNGIMCVNKYLYSNMKFDPQTDLIPAGQLSRVPLIMVLNTKAIKGVTDFDSLVKYTQNHPGEVFFASSGVGTTSHLAGEFLAQQTGLKFTHVPHAGGAAAMIEVLAGRIPFMIDVMANALPHVRKGTLKAIGVSTSGRLSTVSEVPTLQELGIKDYDLCAWDGYVLPKGVQESSVQRLSNAIHKIRGDATVRDRILKMGADPVFSDSVQFKEFIASESEKWKVLAQSIAKQNK